MFEHRSFLKNLKAKPGRNTVSGNSDIIRYFHDNILDVSSSSARDNVDVYFNDEASYRSSDEVSVFWKKLKQFGVIPYTHATENKEDFEKSSLTTYVNRLVSAIKNSSYEDGCLSPADFVVEQALESHGEDFVYKIVNQAWQVFFVSANQDFHAHILNVVKNLSYKVDRSLYVPIAIAAYSHKDVVTREAGLSVFESWDDPSHRDILESVADSGIEWLDSYKRDVIENLGV